MAVLSRLLLATNCQKLSHINGLLQKLLPKNNSCTFQNQNGAIPATLIVLYANIMIGPATLEPIPEGYNPQAWEYYKHPITRFLAKYIVPDLEVEYEKYIHKLRTATIKRKLRYLEQEVKYNIYKNSDYQYWSYKTAPTKDIIDIRKRIDAADPTV
ncbi:unnamed protein product [Xylocopa violacea]|uniref:NADH dehydrogenase [ubiquinone] 1 beta subcomplex subunit 5, mitochondrial n=1 Tax=Xylocopa violacea TaxID=135666 RepID=A0ABP1NJW5_XYLVO